MCLKERLSPAGASVSLVIGVKDQYDYSWRKSLDLKKMK